MKWYHLLLFGAIACTSTQESQTESLEETPFEVQKKATYIVGGVTASNEEDGMRLNNFIQLSDNEYQAVVSPENIPVNASAWYAFKLWGSQERTIRLSIKYTHHKHRYNPKLSVDGDRWLAMETPISLNGDSTVATFPITISQDTLWISAQELISSSNTYQWLDQLLASNSYLKKEVAGTSVLGNDLFVVSSEIEASPSVVLIARQHPPEVPGGTIAFRAFFETLLADTELATSFRDQFNLYVFPLLNPDGANLGNWRHNADGIDLNRDWADFSQPETQTARDFVLQKVEEGKEVAFGIDFHTSYSGPYLLILDSLNEASLPTRIIPEWIAGIEVDSLEMGDYRRRDQALPYCYNWFFNTFAAEAVTYEEGDEIDRGVIRARAQLYATEWMKSLLNSLN